MTERERMTQETGQTLQEADSVITEVYRMKSEIRMLTKALSAVVDLCEKHYGYAYMDFPRDVLRAVQDVKDEWDRKEPQDYRSESREGAIDEIAKELSARGGDHE